MTRQPKQFSYEYASIFQDSSVVAAYLHRPPYPLETFDRLAGLIDRSVKPRRILDAGCGTGQMTSGLRSFVDAIDAVDISAAMIEAGKQLPYGSDPAIHWIVGGIEEVTVQPPYVLIVAAASIHWMPWEATLARFARVLSDHGYLALVENPSRPNAWDKEMTPIMAHYSINRDYQPYNMLTVADELQSRGLFAKIGVLEVAPVLFRQPVEAWIDGFHATNGFSRQRMGEERAAEFDQQLRKLILSYCPNGEVEQQIGARIVFGKPLSPATQMGAPTSLSATGKLPVFP